MKHFETLPCLLLSPCSRFSGFDPDFEKHLSRSNVPSCSWDVQQKKLQTGTHWTGIDAQLGGALMSRKAVFSFFLLSAAAVQMTQRRQWEGEPSAFTSSSKQNIFREENESWYLCCRWFHSWKVAGSIPAVSLLSIPVEWNKAPGRPLTPDPSGETTTCLRYSLFFSWLMIKLPRNDYSFKPWNSKSRPNASL